MGGIVSNYFNYPATNVASNNLAKSNSDSNSENNHVALDIEEILFKRYNLDNPRQNKSMSRDTLKDDDEVAEVAEVAEVDNNLQRLDELKFVEEQIGAESFVKQPLDHLISLKKERHSPINTFLLDNLILDTLNISHSNSYLDENVDELKNADLDILTTINSISYNDNKPTDFSWLQYFPNVKSLTCIRTIITSLQMLHKSKYLRIIRFESNDLKDISDLKYLNLTILICTDNPIEIVDLSNFKNFKELKSLDVSRCQLTDLTIKSLHQLSIIYCEQNNIYKLILEDLPKLQGLMCQYNRLSTIDLSKIKNLKYMNYEHNNDHVHIIWSKELKSSHTFNLKGDNSDNSDNSDNGDNGDNSDNSNNGDGDNGDNSDNGDGDNSDNGDGDN